MTATQKEAPSCATIDTLAASIYPPLAMLAGMQLEVFTPLGEGPRTAEALAKALGVQPLKLRPLLHALVTAGLLTEEGGRFSNTPEAAHYLVKGRPDYVGEAHFVYRSLWEATFQTAESIRTGRPQADRDFSKISKEEMLQLFKGREPGARAAGKKLHEQLGFSCFRSLLDVGGGSGSVARAICEECPGMSAAVLELPNVAKVTREYLKEDDAGGRLRVLEGDVTRERPEGSYDLAVLRSFLQVLSPEQARAAVLHVGQVMDAGGMIVIVGRVLDDSRLSPPETVGFNLAFLSLYEHGQAYTVGEHRAWLEEAGFTDFERQVQPDEVSIITATKAG
jgi:hypothetical protein